MRRKSEGRWGEDPKSGAGHPPIPPVDFAPSLNWAGSNASRVNLDSCHSSDLLIESRSPLTAAALDDARTILTRRPQVLKAKSNKY
jgi:hypothetical protein